MISTKIFSVAPMMDWTDTHCRYFMRLLNSNILLYTEMITADALLFGDKSKHLKYNDEEHPIALQLGGSDPEKLKQAAIIAAACGYDEINLNIGCPSDRVQQGSFGACLMAKPELVSECISAIIDSVDIPVTIKTRIGIDDLDSYDFLRHFIDNVVESGCNRFIIHARKAILSGLSPKENRTIPPLNYERVYRLKSDYEHLHISVNGGINSLDDCKKHLALLDGVMIGRFAYHQPWFLYELRALTNSCQKEPLTREDIVDKMCIYIESQIKLGVKLNHITRHMLGLYSGQPGARAWRRYLSTHAHIEGAGIEVLQDAKKKLLLAA